MKMWRTYETEISYAHYIKGHPKCGELHGHNAKIKVWVEAIEDFLDFHEIADEVKKVLKKYDHKNLGHFTCEDLAKAIYDELKKVYGIARSIRVEVKETSKFGVVVEDEI